MTAARAFEPEMDPVLRAVLRARVGGPLTEDERRAKEQAEAEPCVDGEEMTAEIARRAEADKELR